MAALHFNDANFEKEVLQSSLPVLVDFWAEWCGPCRMMGPIIDAVAQDLAAELKVGKVNVDESPNVAGQYGIMSIPTIILFKGGKPAQQFVGAMPKEALAAKVKAAL
ncbi:MAG: thioredoxin [Candidatus Omnitrophica bacterium]|nr:thioredoxin [Candidatus Omnitrophota bacterium]